MKKNEQSYDHLRKDLLLFLVLQGTMLALLIGMHLYDQSTGYFSNLAAQIYSQLVN